MRFIFPACGLSHVILLVRIFLPCLGLVSWLMDPVFQPFLFPFWRVLRSRVPWQKRFNFFKKNCFFLQVSVKRKKLLTVRHNKAEILTVHRKYLHPIENLISWFNSPTFYMLYCMLMNNNRSRLPKVPICDITLRHPFPVF